MKKNEINNSTQITYTDSIDVLGINAVSKFRLRNAGISHINILLVVLEVDYWKLLRIRGLGAKTREKILVSLKEKKYINEEQYNRYYNHLVGKLKTVELELTPNSIQNLGLSATTFDILFRNDLRTVDGIISILIDDVRKLLKIRGIGKKRAKEILSALVNKKYINIVGFRNYCDRIDEKGEKSMERNKLEELINSNREEVLRILAEGSGEKFIRKSVTVPESLNKVAVEAGLNFSQCLRDGIVAALSR